MLDTTTRDAAQDFIAHHWDALRVLPTSPLRSIALDALDLYAAAWDDAETTEAEDEARDAAFWELIDRAAATPATLAHDAACKAVLVALLADRECTDQAQRIAEGLAADLAQLGHDARAS